jgi:hypothetical protein
VLFDGKDLSKWQGGLEKNPNWTDQPATWKVQDGYVEVTRRMAPTSAPEEVV